MQSVKKYLLLLALVLSLAPAHAFPAFARRYSVDCTTCHTVPPRLNNYGIAFMRRGFKMDWEEKLEGQKPTDYFAIQKQLDVTNTNTDLPQAPGSPPPAATTAQVTQISLLTAGPMSPQLSWYGELDYNPVAFQTSVHELRGIVFFPKKLTDEGDETYYSISAGAIRPFSTWQKGLTEVRGLSSPLIFGNALGVPSFIPDNPQYGVEFGYNQFKPGNGYSHGTYATAAIMGGLNANAQTGTTPVGL
ncbi:MAG: hypothetical protein ACYCW6_17690, partial [Candidatus Xenobia bacterium]